MNDSEILKQLNYNLTCNQTPSIKGQSVIIDVFRGSAIRGNRHKVSSLVFRKNEIIEALKLDTVTELVSDAESALSIPLVSYREWA